MRTVVIILSDGTYFLIIDGKYIVIFIQYTSKFSTAFDNVDNYGRSLSLLVESARFNSYCIMFYDTATASRYID